jgi:hypothetical protein
MGCLGTSMTYGLLDRVCTLESLIADSIGIDPWIDDCAGASMVFPLSNIIESNCKSMSSGLTCLGCTSIIEFFCEFYIRFG